MDEDNETQVPISTIYYEVKPVTENPLSPSTRNVKSITKDEMSKMKNPSVDNSAYLCECGKPYRTEASLRFHKYECGRPPTFVCPYCNYVGKRNTTLRKHIKARHDMII